MNEIISTAKTLSAFIPIVKPVIEKYLTPKLEIILKNIRKKNVQHNITSKKLYETKFQDYLCRTLERSSILNTLVFPNQQILIDNLYQPLTLSDNCHRGEGTLIDKFPDYLFDKYQRVLVCDNAGMGKSTLSRYICTQSIREEIGIPIFIELRRLNSLNKIIDEVFHQLNPIEEIFDKDLILQLLDLGEFIIILDGFDEISNSEQEIVTRDIRDFVFGCTNNRFLLTSRPEEAISTFGDFKIHNINGLTEEEAFLLLKKYDKITNLTLSDNLISEISGTNNPVKEFLDNPFLVSLLYKTYSYKRDIPSRKSTFYNEVFTALYQDHDLSKESYKRNKYSNLDILEFKLVLREFAILTAKIGEIGYSESKATEYISKCQENLPFIKFKPSAFICDLLSTVPLFVKDGNNIKWAHKSLQDYFAAEYISSHALKVKMIQEIIETNITKYTNVLDLIIELDPNLIRQYILPDILKGLISHYHSSYNLNSISEVDLAVRRMITFDKSFWICQADSDIQNNVFTNAKEKIKGKYGIKSTFGTCFNSEQLVMYTQSNYFNFIQLVGQKGMLGKSILKQKKRDFPKKEILPEFPTKIDNNNTTEIYNYPEYFSLFTNLLISSYNFRARNRENLFLPNISTCIETIEAVSRELEHCSDKTSCFGF